MKDTDSRRQPDWDPRDPAVLADQRQSYDDMRDRCPVAYSDFIGWSLFRYDDVVEALGDPAVFSNAARHPAIPNGMDPPEHARYRAAMEGHFSEASMAALEPACRAIARSLVANIANGEQVEFVSAFAEPFALRTLCVFLGWPEEDWEALGRLDSWQPAGRVHARTERRPRAGQAARRARQGEPRPAPCGRRQW